MTRYAEQAIRGFCSGVKKEKGRSLAPFLHSRRKQLPSIFPLPGEAGHDKPV
jgi:hypothetical protein